MNGETDNETWLIDAGDEVIRKRAGDEEITSRDQLIYCFWVADYGMRNSGRLTEARELYPQFQAEARIMAETLRLDLTRKTFALSPSELEAVYFDRFDEICDEIRNA